MAKDRARESIGGLDGKAPPDEAYIHYSHWYAEGSMEDLRFRFTSRLRETMRRMRVMLEDELRAEGLTRALWEALFVVVLSGGGSTQKSLARWLRIEGATLVRLLDRLEADGLIQRVQDEGDRRAKTIEPTRRGTAMARRLVKRSDAVRAQLLDGWSEDDLKQGIALFSRIATPDKGKE